MVFGGLARSVGGTMALLQVALGGQQGVDGAAGGGPGSR